MKFRANKMVCRKTIKHLLIVMLSLSMLGIQIVDATAAATVVAPKIRDKSIKIDAVLDDWQLKFFADENKIVLTPKTTSHINGAIKDDKDGSAIIYAAYDSQNLYLGAQVTDDKTYAEQKGDAIWQNDCMEIWFDGANNAGPFPGEADNYQVVVDRNGAIHGYRNANVNKLVAQIDNAATRQGTSYTLEVQILLKAIDGLDLKEGMGFNITIVDADAAHAAGGWNRLFWQGNVDVATDTWGDLHFGEALAVEPQDKLGTTWGKLKNRY
jgi:hypothetical protein